MPSRFPARAAALAANLLLCVPALAAPALAAPAGAAGGVPALYPSQAEAEKAARQHFHCTGAHRMGNQWMPCARHGDAHGSGPSH